MQNHFSLVREFNSVTQKICQYLLQTKWIALDRHRHLLLNEEDKFEILFACGLGKQIDDVFHCSMKIERGILEAKHASLDF